jgi:bifunctional non-homologous end joining protein LigD
MSLREYERKRDFKRTAEPPARKPRRKARSLRFVIQKHDASRLHYDFRLELDGTLKSWAVPKGVPFVRGDKRLAVHVEDHPIDYANFEGIIPEGQYGGGTVMVWDTGTWENLGEDAARDLARGKLHFALHGKKLKSEWTLVRTRIESGDKEHWLLIKSGADIKPLSKKKDDESVLSGRTMREIAEQHDKEWQSHRAAAPGKETLRTRIKKRLLARERPAAKSATSRSTAGTGKHAGNSVKTASTSSDRTRSQNHPASSPSFVSPMKARLMSAPPVAGDWIYELKFDGFRALAIKAGVEVELFSRNANVLSHKFPEITDALAKLKAKSAVIDNHCRICVGILRRRPVRYLSMHGRCCSP